MTGAADTMESDPELERYAGILVRLARSKALGGPDFAAALHEILEADARTVGVERVSVWLYDEERTKIRCFDLYELSQDRHSEGVELRAVDYPEYFRALEEARAIAASDAHEDPRTREFSASYLTPLGIGAMLDAPIRLRGESVGVVCHEHVGAARRWSFQEQTFAGSIADLVSLALEAHEHHRAEEALRRSEERLRQAQKMEALGRLAAGIAHDFGNILTGVLGYCRILRLELPPGTAARAYVEEIEKIGRGAASLTQQLLIFSRRQVLQQRRLDLNLVLREMEPILRPLLSEKLELRMDRDPQLGPVMADRSQLEQVVLNLALNARDAMPNGGRLTIETRSLRLDARQAELADAEPGRYAVLRVSDTGVGMDEAVRAHLFEPFFTTKERGQGTGLGLATVDGIVQQSGGFILVDSAPGKGSRFAVWLPEAPENRRSQDAAT
jgi:signal transduction histidine kinase